MEALRALEEEEGDVEGGSGQVEGLKKRGNLSLLLRHQIRALSVSSRDPALESPSKISLVSPALDSQLKTYWMSELAKTNFQPVHFTHEQSEALGREMTCIGSYAPQIQVQNPRGSVFPRCCRR